MDNFRVAKRQRPPQAVDGFVTQRTPYLHTPARQPHTTFERPTVSMLGMDGLSTPASPASLPNPVTPAVQRPPVERRLPGIDMNLEPAPDHPKNRLSTARTFRKWLFRGGLATFCLLLAVGGLLAVQAYIKVHKVFKGGDNHAAALQTNVDPSLLKGEGDGRVNILLLGNGGGSHDAPDLTDTMIVASIDPVNKKAVLLSVPRDLWVQVPNYGSMKINAAYEVGKYNYLGKIDESNSNTDAVKAGFTLADEVVENVLGIPIHYNALVNFTSFQQAVDSVGGVTVDVPTDLYDPTMAWENHNNPVLAKAGVQQMNGTQALLYVRSRETTSDFARGQRQRAVILALKDKALTLGTLSNPLKISHLMSAFGNNMVTDLGLSDAVRLYDIMKGIDNANYQSVDLVTSPHVLVTTASMNGVSVDEPKAGLNNYNDIHDFARSVLKDGYLVNENARITILNGTTTPGLAGEKADQLKTYGYNVVKVDNAPTQAYSKTVVVDLTNGKDKYTKHYLENRFGVTAVTQVPDSSIQTGGSDFIIILGNDESL